LQAGGVLQADANQFVNSSHVEEVWAIKCYKHAEVYLQILKNIDPCKVRLTNYDDIIYRQYKRLFRNLKIDMLDDDEIRSVEAKAKWRPFCEKFKGKIEDYNFGSLLRRDCSKDFSEENTILVPRIQCIAIELARNRKGLNKHFFTKTIEQEANGNVEGLYTNVDSQR